MVAAILFAFSNLKQAVGLFHKHFGIGQIKESMWGDWESSGVSVNERPLNDAMHLIWLMNMKDVSVPKVRFQYEMRSQLSEKWGHWDDQSQDLGAKLCHRYL